MANDEDLARLRQGVAAWNAWRAQNPERRVDLSGADLSRANLRRAIFKLWADVSGVDLRGADLSGMELSGADLRGMDVRGADIWRTNPHWAHLSDMDLRGMDLRGADLRGMELSGANLHGADLHGADLHGADLRGANLCGMDLRGANLYKADLYGTHLRGADLRGVDLSGGDLRGAKLRGANLCGAYLHEKDLSGMGLRETNLRGANLCGAHLSGADLTGAFLIGANLHEAKLSGADLRDANLRQATLIDSRLGDANLTGAKLWETQRDGWSIKGVTCQRAFWDRDGKEPTEYGVGDFERVFAEKPRIVLRYSDGIPPIDLIMLPLIVERLQAEHPDCTLHIRSVQDDGSGATVTITVEDIANRDRGTFRHEVERLQTELKYIEGQRDLLRDQFMPIFRELVVRGGQTIIGQITNLAMIGGSVSKDTYNIQGQTGAVGPNAHAHDMTFQQVWSQSGLDLSRLAQELARLRDAMKQEPEGTAEQDAAIGAVAAAEKAAAQGDGPTVLRHLKAAGKWTLGIAEKISVTVAAEAIKSVM